MLEEQVVSCPVCDNELYVKVSGFGNKVTYIVSSDCPNCKTSANKIERMLNKPKGYTKTEKSYMKLDPRARG